MKITAATISSKIQTKNADFKVNVPIKVYLYFSFKVQKIPCQISSNEAMRAKRGLPVSTDVCTQVEESFSAFFVCYLPMDLTRETTQIYQGYRSALL